jgi:hypothetical protein
MKKNPAKHDVPLFVNASPPKPFTLIPIEFLMDRSLSFEAKGLWCAILSFQEQKRHPFKAHKERLCTLNDLIPASKESPDELLALLKELEEAGFIEYEENGGLEVLL